MRFVSPGISSKSNCGAPPAVKRLLKESEMTFEVIEHNGVRYAEVLWGDTRVRHTKFFSPAASSMQFGLLAHEAGFVEAPHYHKDVTRTITDMQQMLVVQRGIVAIEFYRQDGQAFRKVILNPGDAILLVHGAHSVKVIEDMQCVSVKQGPFLGPDMDKINLEIRKA
jgi:hypothetical protein